MKRIALFLALVTLTAFIAIPVLANLEKYGAQRGPAPKGWTKFDWPAKKEILLGHYAPTQEELVLIDKALPAKATMKPKKDRRILLFYKCIYPHTSIATGIAAFEKLAEKTKAYSVDVTDDPAKFTTSNLANYDAVLLNNSVDWETFLNDEQRTVFMEFLKSGKGLIGIHAASDACKNWKEGAAVMGGIFKSHPWTSGGTWAFQVESPLHPLNAAWDGKGDLIRDEVYHYRPGTFSRQRSRVLLSLDLSKERNFVGKGFNSKNSQDADPKGDYPIAWIHEVGQGRVFYSNLGHNNSTYWNPKVLQHYLDGIQYALGDLPADATPSASLKNVFTKEAPLKKIIFLAGKKSHASGDHEYRAGSLLLANRLNAQTDLPIQAEVTNGWPKDDSILDDAAAIVIYCDSDSVVRKNYEKLMQLSEQGTGLLFMHYGVHPKKPEDGRKYYLPTIGGFMETGLSVNPHWVANLTAAKGHPVSRGVEKPVKVLDEFYYNMRFADKAIPLGTAIPNEKKLKPINLWNKNGPAGFGKPQTLLWGFEKPDGTRGAGYTGGHYHRNWAIDGVRTLILNTIVWTAGLDVPEGGVKSREVTEEEINTNLDDKPNMVKIKLPLPSPDELIKPMLPKPKKKAPTKKPPVQIAPKKKTKVSSSGARPQVQGAKAGKWYSLLDQNLTQWDIWMGVPHRSVKIPGHPASTSKDGTTGTPLGLNNDPLSVFSVIEEDGHPVLKITGEIFAGLTTKKEFENYHLTMQFKWGDKKWEPRLHKKRDTGVLLHCVGKHGAFWNAWKRSLECQVQEGDIGDFIGLAGSLADIRMKTEGDKRTWDPKGKIAPGDDYIHHGPSIERPHGEWNTIDIYAVGDQIIHVINGKVNMVLLNTQQKTPHGPAPLTRGQIQIQSEAAECYYRDLKIRKLEQFPKSYQKFLKEPLSGR
ncbi:MAG: ThuA domain-containing protein [Akkermansiaceae bacterium]